MSSAIDPRLWRVTTQLGRGQVARQPSAGVALTVHPTSEDDYADAQFADYEVRHPRFVLTPPLTIRIRAHATTDPAAMRGTAGFGLWNHPFMPGRRRFRLPQALWFFFGSAENNMALAHGMPGHGWKAATINAQRWPFLALLPTAPLAVPLMNLPAAYDTFWPIGQRAIGVHETSFPVAMLRESHEYTIRWTHRSARFLIDAEIVLTVDVGLPAGPLGFIAWMDNQYAVVTPQGRFAAGFVTVEQPQTLMIESATLETR